MPIYEYRCNACGHQLEVMQKLSDPELSDCPSCNQPELRKLISVVGFRLKGSGWYETDFKNGNHKKNIAKDDATPTEASKPSSDSPTSATPTPAIPVPAPASVPVSASAAPASD